MWHVKSKCLSCKDKELTSKGLYNRVCKVVDVSSYYYLATEYLECGKCNKTYLSWSKDILDQLDQCHRVQFTVALTHKLACDVKVVTLLWSHTQGNSSALLHSSLEEMHSEAWLRKALLYLTDCDQHRRSYVHGMWRFQLRGQPVYQPIPEYTGTDSYKWLQACYSQDVLQQLLEVKAQITSIYG